VSLKVNLNGAILKGLHIRFPISLPL